MTKSHRLYQQLLSSSSRSVSFRDFERLLRAFGFELDRTVGSHRHYKHADVPWILTINPDGPTARRYQVRRVLEIVEEFGLHVEA